MTCTRCTAPTADGIYLCARDASALTDVLERIPEAMETVRDTIARLDRVTAGSGRGSTEAKIPVNLEASKRANHLHELTVTWARLLLEVDEPNMRDVAPVAYLRMSVHVIVRHDWSGDMLVELEDALESIMRAVDIPPERVDLGRCGVEGCTGKITGTMTTRDGRKVISRHATCRTCGSIYDGTEVYASLVAETWGEWRPLAESVKAMRSIPGAPSPRTIYRWAEAGKFKTKQDGDEVLYLPAEINAYIQARRELTKAIA